MILSFTDCQIKYNNELLFEKSWGNYDLIVGEKIVSCFPRPADSKSFDQKKYIYQSETIKVNYTDLEKDYHLLYQEVRDIRDKKMDIDRLKKIFQYLEEKSSDEWLLILEIVELAKNIDETLFNQGKDYLVKLSHQKKSIKKLILDGLNIL